MHVIAYVTACRSLVTWVVLLLSCSLVAAGADVTTWPSFCPERCVCGLRSTSGLISRELRAVECSGVGLTSLPVNLTADVELLALGANRIRPEALNALVAFSNMTELNLAENHIYGLSDIRMTLTSLDSLCLDGNQLDYLANGSFWWAPNLRRLSLRGNKIELIDGRAFGGLRQLESLDLAGNRIFSVVPDWFVELPRLRILDLSHNNVHVIRNGAFRSATQLRVLDIGHSQLQHIYDGAFVGLHHVDLLTLDVNNLKTFPVAAFRTIPTLTELSMNGNPLEILDTDSVSRLDVSVLRLSHLDRLHFVDRRAFYNLTNLTRLDLHDNRMLTYVDREAFVGVPRLSQLLLHNNNLSVIEESMLTSMPSLDVIGVHGNSLYCDCSLRWLIDAVHGAGVDTRNLTLTDKQLLTCVGPSALHGTRLTDVDVTTIPTSCAPRILPLYSMEYDVDLGDTLVLNCRAVGLPPPQTDWLLPAHRRRLSDVGADVILLKSGDHAAPDVDHVSDHVTVAPSGTLTVEYAQAHDAGQYTCLASNPRGRDERTARVSVETDLADVIVLGASAHSVTVTWRSRRYQHSYRILYRQSATNATYRSVDIEPYMRSFTANDLTPTTVYEFCIAVRHGQRTVNVNCTTVVTASTSTRGRRDGAFGSTSGLFDARHVIVGGVVGCLTLFVAVVCTSMYFIRRYNRRKRAEEELYTDNFSQLFLASMDSMSDTTPITYENVGAIDAFDEEDDDDEDDDDDVIGRSSRDVMRAGGPVPGCSTYTTVIR